MSTGQINLTAGNPLLRNLMMAEGRIRWGDLDIENQEELEKLGYYGMREREIREARRKEDERNWYAEQERRMRDNYGSERRESSGWTTEMEEEEKILPRKARTKRIEHYKRKAVLEEKKEAERRARYAAAGLSSPEVAKMEAARKTRKAHERRKRKEAKKTLRQFVARIKRRA